MKIAVSQVYIEVGINFPFSYHLQVFLSQKLSEYTQASKNFTKRYGADFTIVYNMSAKASIPNTEVRGPTVFKKTKDVEYSIFLPYDVIDKEADKVSKCASALDYFLRAVVKVLETLEIDASEIKKNISSLVEQACSNPIMFNQDEV